MVSSGLPPSCTKIIGSDSVNSSIPYGGIAQQNPMDPRGIVQRLQRLEAESSDVFNCKQYHSEKVCGNEATVLPSSAKERHN
jgi:hypothetical protein